MGTSSEAMVAELEGRKMLGKYKAKTIGWVIRGVK